MVFKFVTTASQGNLWNAADMYGLGDDILHLVIPSPNHATIRTYSGNDFVTVVNTPSGWQGYKFYLGIGNDTLLGSSKNDYYYDEGGDDLINMGAGDDLVLAGPGNDTIDGGNGVDAIDFGSMVDMFGNFSPIAQGVTLNLGSTGPQDLGFYGIDTFVNFERIYGGPGDDTFLGTNGYNFFLGGEGADHLRGLGGNDHISGGDGGDTLIGDAGADDLYAGIAYETESDGASDTFKYFRLSDSTYEDGMDTIFNFEHFAGGGTDKIDLSFIDATSSLVGNQSFLFVGSAGFSSANGEVMVTTVGDKSVVMVDNDGDAAAEMVIIVEGVTGLTANDFIL